VLSRGYGGQRRGGYWLRVEQGRLLVNGREEAVDPSTRPSGSLGTSPRLATGLRDLPDEPQLLAERLQGIPIVVGARRDRTGQLACREFACDTVILDDGFQHRRLARDCEIVLVHARMPLGGWALLPRGPMREPVGSLARADIVVLTNADEALPLLRALEERLRAVAPRAVFVTARHVPTGLREALTGVPHDPARLTGLRVGLLSSIGDPAGFEATVGRLHATVLWHRSLPDHHPYQASDWLALAGQAAHERPDAVLTTEKDWVRLAPVAAGQPQVPLPLWVLGVEMQLMDGKEDFDARLAGVYDR